MIKLEGNLDVWGDMQMVDALQLMLVTANMDALELMSDALCDVKNIELICGAVADENTLTKIAENAPDVLLMDLMLGKVNGFELLGEIKRLENAPAVIVQSNFLTPAVSRKCSELGAVAVISQPYRFRTLVDRIFFAYENKFFKDDCGVIDYEAEQIYLTAANELMHEIGIPMKYSGYKHLRAAIIVSLTSGAERNRMSIEIYPAIARQFGSSVYSVERDIRTIINAYWKLGGHAILERKLGICLPEKKLSNASFLAIMVDQVQYKMARRHVI